MTPLGNVPPQNLEAEKCVLGSLLLDQRKVAEIVTVLAPDDFYTDAHRTIFASILSLHRKRVAVDLLTLTNHLVDSGQLDAVGGRSAIAELTEFVPTASNVLEYAEIIRRKAAYRRLIHVGSEIAGLGFRDDDDDTATYAAAQQLLLSAMRTRDDDRLYTMERMADEFYTEYAELREGSRKPDLIPTGIGSLDYTLHGFKRSDYIVLAARSSMGKTAMAGHFAAHAASLHKRTLVFSLEMYPNDIYRRLLASASGVNSWRLSTAETVDSEHTRVMQAVDATRSHPLTIVKAFGYDVATIRSVALKHQATGGLDLIVVDYVGLIRGHYSANRAQEVSQVSKGLKLIAQELNVPLIALAQINRGVETRGRNDKRPVMSDLKESGSLEEDPDKILLLYRPWYYDKDADPAELQVIIAKYRNGPTGEVCIDFDPTTSRFKDRPQASLAA